MSNEESSKEANIKAIWRRTAVTNGSQHCASTGMESLSFLSGFGESLEWLLFFKTNMERTEQCGCSTIYKFAHSVENTDKEVLRAKEE